MLHANGASLCLGSLLKLAAARSPSASGSGPPTMRDVAFSVGLAC